MVVAFHLEDHGQPVADIHHAGILAGALDDAGTRGGQRPQPHLGRTCRSSARFHMAETMPSSVMEGSRPISVTKR